MRAYSVVFKENGKGYYFKSEDIFELNDKVIVETEKGLQFGKISGVVLTDLKMPKMGGEEVLKVIRQVRPYVFVIIYTNFSEFTDIKALVNIGIDGYVNKGADADLQELVNMIKEKLEPFSVDEVQNIMDGVNIQKKE